MDAKVHTRFLRYCLNVLPSKYEAQEVNRLTLAYFVINALEALGQLETALPAEGRQQTVDWIYSLQVVPGKDQPEQHSENFGFRGSPFYGYPFDAQCTASDRVAEHDQGHLAMDYCALSLLAVLGDDLSRIDRPAILAKVRQLQQEDGSFSPVTGGSEKDMRFVYCAAAVCYMLDDWSGMDCNRAAAFIASSQRPDGGISQGGGKEAHGGSTYCAVAALHLMGRLEVLDRDALIEWLAMRQTTGFQGRVNKPPDSCYGFWIGASLKLLGVWDQVVDTNLLASFINECSGEMGGFGKHADAHSDVLHTYYSLCALSLCGTEGLQEIAPHLAISKRAAAKYDQKKE